MRLPRSILRYGTEAAPDPLVHLRAGGISLFLDGPDLRYLSLGGREFLRRIYFAVRDANWSTAPVQVSNLETNLHNDAFEISYDARNQLGGIDFTWRGTITGQRDGTVIFDVQGEAQTTFLRNRMGICVLHPIMDCAGLPCRIEHADGTIQETAFPFGTSPHQPFLDIRAMSHEVAPGVLAEVRFEGEIFETEDQRNWTDASYKTYSTPLRIPYPVRVEAGTKLRQSVRLSIHGSPPIVVSDAKPQAVRIMVDSGAVQLKVPAVGLSVASHGKPLSPNEIRRLRDLRLAHLRVDLNLANDLYLHGLAQASQQAAELGVPLEVAVTVNESAEQQFQELRREIDRLKPAVDAWVIFHSQEAVASPPWVDLARKHLGDFDRRAKIGAGSKTTFAELNRNRGIADHVDLICYSVTPQVHALDNRSLVENLEGQIYPLRTARQFAGDTPIAVTPITLKSRTGAHKSPLDDSLRSDSLPPSVDVRQMSLFGAAWTLGSLKYLGEGGAERATYFETTGWLGVMETENGSPQPDLFPSLPGSVFPLYHVFRDVCGFPGAKVLPTSSSHPLIVTALVLRSDLATRMLLANHSDESQSVEVWGAPLGSQYCMRILDETTAEQAMMFPEAFAIEIGAAIVIDGNVLTINLPPLAVARIDSPLQAK